MTFMVLFHRKISILSFNISFENRRFAYNQLEEVPQELLTKTAYLREL